MGTVSDTFTRGDEDPIVGDWTSGEGDWGDLQLTTNHVEASVTNSDSAIRWTAGPAFDADDQFSEGDVINGGGNSVFVGVSIQNQSGADESCYVLYWVEGPQSGDDLTFQFYEIDSALGFTLLGASISGTWTGGDTLRIEGFGTAIEGFQNGGSIGTRTAGTSITSGDPGIAIFSKPVGDGELDNWNAGDFAVGGAVVKDPIGMGIIPFER